MGRGAHGRRNRPPLPYHLRVIETDTSRALGNLEGTILESLRIRLGASNRWKILEGLDRIPALKANFLLNAKGRWEEEL